MPSNQKTICKKFNIFRGGQGQEYVIDDNKFWLGSNIELNDNGAVQLSKHLNVVVSSYGSVSADVAQKNLAVYDDTVYCLAARLASPEKLVLLKSVNNGNFSVAYTFADYSSEPGCLISLGDLFFFSFLLSTTNKLAISSDHGSTWSTSASSYFFEDFFVVGDTIYCLSGDCVYTTKDGVNFTLHVALMEYDVHRIVWYENALHILACAVGDTSHFFHLRFQIELERLREFHVDSSVEGAGRAIDMLATSSGLYFLAITLNRVKLIKYDTAVYSTFSFSYDDVVGCSFLVGNSSKIFFCLAKKETQTAHIEQLRYLYSIVEDAVIEEQALSEYVSYQDAVVFHGDMVFCTNDIDADIISVHNSAVVTYNLTGYYELSKIADDDIIPYHLRLTHKPLPAGCSIVVSAKLDYSSSWTVLLTSATADSIKKTYSFALGSRCNVIQFKIDFVSDGVATPDDVVLSFYYKKVGLDS